MLKSSIPIYCDTSSMHLKINPDGTWSSLKIFSAQKCVGFKYKIIFAQKKPGITSFWNTHLCNASLQSLSELSTTKWSWKQTENWARLWDLKRPALKYSFASRDCACTHAELKISSWFDSLWLILSMTLGRRLKTNTVNRLGLWWLCFGHFHIEISSIWNII